MTKPREKTREELTAEIEESKKKIRQFENREKIIKQKLSVEERKARTHRLCKRGGFMESLVPELIAMPDEERERGIIPLEQRAHLYTLVGACALPRAYLRTGTFPALRYGGFAATRGYTPCAAYAAIPAHPQKQYTRPGVCTVFAGFIILSGR